MLNKKVSLKNILKSLGCAALIIGLMSPHVYLSALGSYGDPTKEKPKDDRPIAIDDENTPDPEVEIDESKPVFANDLRRLDPFEEGELASGSIIEGDEKVAENDDLTLYFNETTLIFKVERKDSGYIWTSGRDPEQTKDLSRAWQDFATAPVSLDYIERKNTSANLRDYPVFTSKEAIENGVRLSLNFPRSEIDMEMSVTLTDDNGMTVEILDDSIQFNPEAEKEYLITNLYVMPFLGAAQETETKGYLFVPDGPGALIRFNPARNYSSSLIQRIYGTDEGVNRAFVSLSRIPQVEEPIVHMPVFGIAHGYKQEAFAAIIENGAEEAKIEATPAGVRTNYYWTAPTFVYHEVFFQRTGRGGEGFSYVSDQANTINPKITYRFLADNDADYAGMAKSYREYLDAHDLLPDAVEAERAGQNIPLYTQAFMADMERGLFFNRMKVMTTTDDVRTWLPDLHGIAGEQLILGLLGAQNGGVSGHELGNLDVHRKVGGRGGWNKLRDDADELGVQLALQTETAVGYEPQLRRREMVYNVDRSTASRPTQDFLYDEKFFANLDKQKEIFQGLEGVREDYSDAILDLTGIGYTLLSEHKDGHHIDRSEIAQQQAELLESLSDSHELYLEQPNAYLWGSAGAIYNAPDRHSQLLFETETVPFMQIVLSGRVPIYSSPMNFGAGRATDILNLIDYNHYPTYQITHLESSELRNANTQDMYYSEYNALLPEIQSTYETVNEVLSQVRGATIEDRLVPETDISVTVYSNGKAVVVNYTDEDYTYEGVKVPAKSASVVDGVK